MDAGNERRDLARRDNLFETIANFTYDWETWFAEDGSVKWINPAVERMTGYSVEDCLATPDYPVSLIHPGDRANIADILSSALAGSSGNDVEFRFRHKTGATGSLRRCSRSCARPPG